MSEPQTNDLLRQQSESDQATQAPLSIGRALQAMREAHHLTLADVSVRIKYSTSQLGHLEAEHWERLPGGVPLRGLVRNYARFLETDVDVMLRLLDDAVGPTRPRPTVTSLGAQRALQQADTLTKGEPAHRTWAWLVVLLALAAGLGWYAVSRGWVPDEWLIFDWLKALRP